nr:uncharacterized protein CTRU02_08569 [Colletotrichum truncatum]KAF6789870.1 hypothetical protein CTRU02_08569 [Colletotrichum truncatum]
MQFSSLISSLILALGAVAAPVDQNIDSPYPLQFQAWNWDCNASGAHTLGTYLGNLTLADICLPLPKDTRALDVQVIRAGCRITAFQEPMCNDYPQEGSYKENLGCLWTARDYRSYKLTCK